MAAPGVGHHNAATTSRWLAVGHAARNGLAAALAATVAGLAVAIPALFGYNWLNTKIKEINADMRVFIDEFVTRIAEHYS